MNKHLLYIHPCPDPGHGVHPWCLQAAHDCRKAGLSPDEAIPEIISRMTRHPRPGELQEAVGKAYSTTFEERVYHRVRTTKGTNPRPVKTEYNPAKLKGLADRLPLFDVNDLMEGSPINPLECTAVDFLYNLYLPDDLILIFDRYKSQGQYIWRRPPDGRAYDEEALQEFKEPYPGNGAWFLCNPIEGESYEFERLISSTNPTGRSRRAEECLTDFRYCLVESDDAPQELWLKALVQLPLPIVSVCDSGGRSLHSLVRFNARDGVMWREAMARIAPFLFSLGACKGTATPAQLTRLPGSYRAEKNTWQRLLYLNPAADETPICKIISY